MLDEEAHLAGARFVACGVLESFMLGVRTPLSFGSDLGGPSGNGSKRRI